LDGAFEIFLDGVVVFLFRLVEAFEDFVGCAAASLLVGAEGFVTLLVGVESEVHGGEVAGFGGLGFELDLELLDQGFVADAFDFREEDQGAASEAEDRGVEGTALFAGFGGGAGGGLRIFAIRVDLLL
jgi:hypothetical protein